jgi:L-ornithine Nalpha-acyltransferase
LQSRFAAITCRESLAGMKMRADDPNYSLRLAAGEADLRGAQRLRYRVFVQEMGGDGPLVDHAARLERDEFDALFDHLLLIDPRIDPATGDHVVGAYRLLTSDRVGAGQFYSESEYDLSVLRQGGRKLLELGRSCVHPDHRGGTAMFHLWNGLADYVLERGVEVLFGVASFHGVEVGQHAQALSWLHHHHLAPEALRVTARDAQRIEMAMVPPEGLDKVAAMAAIPALIKAYLRLGGFVGDGAWLDRAFNTTDVCLVMDTGRMSEKHRAFYLRKQGRAQ